MRRNLRSILAGALVATVALGFGAAGTAVAATATPVRVSLDQAICIPAGGDMTYCIDRAGSLVATTSPDGRTTATMHIREHTLVFAGPVGGAAPVAEIWTTAFDQLRFDAVGDMATVQMVGHARIASGSVRCSSTTVVRITDAGFTVSSSLATTCG